MTGSQSINPADIAWADNTAKRNADTFMYEALAYHIIKQQAKRKKPLRILSFPAQTWEWEQGLKSVYANVPMSFIGLERDPVLHSEAAAFAAGFPKKLKDFAMSSAPCDFATFAARCSIRRLFDVIYLDWMGTWSREKKEDLSVLFRRDLLAIGGLLITTVSLRRGRPETTDELHDLSYDLPLAFYDARGEDKYTRNIKVRGIPHWIANHAQEQHDIVMRPLLASIYYSKTGLSDQTQPQLQIMMLRES